MMEPPSAKPSFLRNILVRALLFGVVLIVLRSAYVVTTAGGSCNLGDFCFFSIPENINLVIAGAGGSGAVVNEVAKSQSAAAPKRRDPRKSKAWVRAVRFYSSVFQDLMVDAFLSPGQRTLCVGSVAGEDVFALRDIGVMDSIGIAKKASPPLVKSGKLHRLPFGDDTFDFIFSGGGHFDRFPKPADVAAELERTLKLDGFLVVHVRANDTYSFNSFLEMFKQCTLLRSLDIDGFESSMPRIREIVLRKVGDSDIHSHLIRKSKVSTGNKCSVPEYKQKLVRNAEPLIEEEPLKPWITLKRNIQNIKYLPSMVDISFKNRYVYVDVGARSYGSSIGSWFRKQYPKQNKTFEVFAIEADKTFHDEYKAKKAVTLLPYAAWVKNESLFFEINRDPDHKVEVVKGRGMGRIQPKQSSAKSDGEVVKIKGFDFAEWLKRTVSAKDFVVMKMDVEGTEFDLIPRLFKTGAICLIDEIFLECHYNRWQRCCPGERSSKYEKTYRQCLDLFNSLRQSGILVHQWW